MGRTMPAMPRGFFRHGLFVTLMLALGGTLACEGNLVDSGPVGPSGNDPTEGLDPIPPSDPFAPPAAETGRLKVKTITTGSPIDGPGWFVSIEDGPTAPIDINQTVVISDVPTGNRLVILQGLADNCALSQGNNPRSMNVARDLVAQTEFHVACSNPRLGSIGR